MKPLLAAFIVSTLLLHRLAFSNEWDGPIGQLSNAVFILQAIEGNHDQMGGISPALEVGCAGGQALFRVRFGNQFPDLGQTRIVNVSYRFIPGAESRERWQFTRDDASIGLRGNPAASFLQQLYAADSGTLEIAADLGIETTVRLIFDVSLVASIFDALTARCSLSSSFFDFGQPSGQHPEHIPSSQDRPPEQTPSETLSDLLDSMGATDTTPTPDEVRTLAPQTQQAIAAKISQCWYSRLALPVEDDSHATILARLRSDGSVARAIIEEIYGQDRDAARLRSAAEAALRAVQDPNCHPLPIPEGGYREGDVIRIIFEF